MLFRSNQAVIRAEGVCKSVPTSEGSLSILESIDLEINAGGTVAIVGASGSGKTTLLGILAGLDLPTSGRVFLVGEELTSLDEEQRARVRGEQVGFVFQTFNLMPRMSIDENVALPLQYRGGTSRRQRLKRARALLERLGLADRIGHRPDELSGGERQRAQAAEQRYALHDGLPPACLFLFQRNAFRMSRELSRYRQSGASLASSGGRWGFVVPAVAERRAGTQRWF